LRVITGTFPSEDDVSDYFFFDLIASHRVRIKRTHIAGGQHCDWVLCDASLVIKDQSAQLSNHDEEIRTSILPAGRYYIQVFHRPMEAVPNPTTSTMLWSNIPQATEDALCSRVS
jgi:hypothetical protein